jgi:fimbrial chaperone protein
VKILFPGCIASLLLFVFQNCFGTALKINPVRLSLSEKQPVQSIQITNEGEQSVVYQFLPRSWLQDPRGQDQYVRTTDLLVSPEIITLAPKASQLIRVTYQNLFLNQSEMPYRLILKEVIGAHNPNEPKMGSDFALEVYLPVFVTSKDTPIIQYDWRIEKKSENKNKLIIHNTGTKHILLDQICFKDKSNRIIFKKNKLFKYILPGMQTEIALDVPKDIVQAQPGKYSLILSEEE